MKKVFACLCVLCVLLTGCASGGDSPVKQIEAAKHAIDPVAAEAFLGRNQDKAMQLFKLTKNNGENSDSGESYYTTACSWCGMELDTRLCFFSDVFFSLTAETTLDDSKETRAAAEACVKLFREQFLDYGYTHGTISEGALQSGTNFMYEEGAEEEAFREFWAKEGGAYLSFRFYLDENRNSYEWMECRFARSDTNPDQVEFHFEGSRTVSAILE